MEIVIAVLASFAVVSILAWFLCKNEIKHVSRQMEQELAEKNQSLTRQEGQAKMILSSIDLGVLYYDQKDQLAISNTAAHELLSDIPQDFLQFLDRYGEENSLRSQLFLGKSGADAILREGRNMIYLKVLAVREKQSAADNHIAMLRDVTRQFGEERQRKEFVSNVSHELRTPLTTIKSYSESLIDWGIAEKTPAQIKKDVSKIYDDSILMEKLIDDLYLLSSLDENSINRSLHVEALDFARLIKLIVERMQDQTKPKKIRMTCHVVSQVPPVYADRTQLDRIVVNLISNAIKYGREMGEIQVYVGCLRDEVYVKVKDDGCGISEEDQKHIFERFYRVDDSRSRHNGGRGLGLAIVRELVELHQGTISVSSTLTRGSEFTVMFPSAAKMMRSTLFDLMHNGSDGSRLAEAATRDLEELAHRLGIVAKWASLSEEDKGTLLAKLEQMNKLKATAKSTGE